MALEAVASVRADCATGPGAAPLWAETAPAIRDSLRHGFNLTRIAPPQVDGIRQPNYRSASTWPSMHNAKSSIGSY